MTEQHGPVSNIPVPDPSVIANERLAEAVRQLRGEMSAMRSETKHWVDALQLLHEEKIRSSEEKTASLDRVVQTRLAGSETALNAAMVAADKVTQKIEINFGAVMNEMKAGVTKQIDTIKEGLEDLKGRLDRGEGLSKDRFETSANDRDNRRDLMAGQSNQLHGNQNMIAIVAAIAGILGMLTGLWSLVYAAMRPSPAIVYAAPSEPAPHVQRQRIAAPSGELPEV